MCVWRVYSTMYTHIVLHTKENLTAEGPILLPSNASQKIRAGLPIGPFCAKSFIVMGALKDGENT